MASEKHIAQHSSAFTMINPANMPSSVANLTLTVADVSGFVVRARAEIPYKLSDPQGNLFVTTISMKIMEVNTADSTISLMMYQDTEPQYIGYQALNPNLIVAGNLVQPAQVRELTGMADAISFAYQSEPVVAIRVMTVDQSGTYVAGGGGGGGAGDASAANQVISNARLNTLIAGQTTAQTALDSLVTNTAGPNTSGVNGAKLATATPTIIRVGASNLAGRKTIKILPQGGDIVYGFSAGLTLANGMPVVDGQSEGLDIGDAINLYVLRVGATDVDVRIVELS